MTDPSGNFVFDLPAPKEVEVLCRAPYVLSSVDKPKARERVVQAERKFKTKLIWPVPDDQGLHKQWVNLASHAEHPERGSRIKIRIGCETKDDGAPGEPVHLELTYGADNSDRTPLPGGQPKGTVLTLTKPLDARKEIEVELELGHAGGDRVTVKFGGTEARADGTLVVENWRQLYYELMAPESMKDQLPPKPLADGKSGRELPGEMTGWMEPRLDKAFIKYGCIRSQVWKLKDGPAGTIYDGAFVGSGAEKVCVLGRHTRRAVPAGVSFSASPDARAVLLTLCNYLFQGDAPPADVYVETESGTIDCPSPDGAYLFPVNMTKGTPALSDVVWEALVDPVADPAHPGVAGGIARVEPGSPDWLSLTDWQTLRITLPSANPDDPGNLAGPLTDSTCPIRVWFRWSLAVMLNGSAGGGSQAIVMERPLPAAAVTTCHELGHSMGMTMVDAATDPAKRYPPPAGMAFPGAVPGGPVYEGHGHNGPHCAEGLGDTSLASFEAEQGSCILFGSGGDEDPPARDQFCDTCLLYLKGRRLTDIRSAWAGRKDEEC